MSLQHSLLTGTSATQTLVRALRGPALERLIIYIVLNSFENQLFLEAGAFQYQDGTIAFGGPGGEGVQNWDPLRKGRLKQLATELQELASVRHWLYHATKDAVDLVNVLHTMNYVLFQLRGIKANTTPAPARGTHPSMPRWPIWSKVLDSISSNVQSAQGHTATFDVTVQLVSTGQRMSIPVSRINHNWLVGRVAELERAVEAVLLVRRLSTHYRAAVCVIIAIDKGWPRSSGMHVRVYSWER